MKNLFVNISFLLLLFAAANVQAQDSKLKLGHVNIQELLENLPAYKDVQTKLQGYANQMQAAMDTMQNEYERKMTAYQQDEPDLTPAMKEIRQQEITDLQGRMEKLQSNAEAQIGDKQVELLKPLEDTVMAAIKSVAAEKGYSYIFDSSKGGSLLFFPDADDLTALLKTKLGAKSSSSSK